MLDINTEGLKVAPLDNTQLNQLLQTEKSMNQDMKDEVYLLAVTRKKK